jgi:hypothetical protein
MTSLRRTTTVLVSVLGVLAVTAGAAAPLASAGGGAPRTACEITLKNDSTMSGELESAQNGPNERWTARPTGDLRSGTSRTFSAEDWQPPGPCRITVSYTFRDPATNERISAFGLVAFDGNEGDAECNVFGSALKCSASKSRDGATLRAEVVFTQ